MEQPRGKLLHIKNGQKGVNFREILAQLSQYADIGRILTHINQKRQELQNEVILSFCGGSYDN